MNAQEAVALRADDLQAMLDMRWPEGLMTSCYLSVDGRQHINHGSVMTRLRSMVSRAKADLDKREVSHAARQSARKDLQELETWVEHNLSQRAGAHTLAWFCCSERDLLVARWLPLTLPDRLIQAEDFDETLLLGAIRSVPKVGLVLINHNSVRYYHADISQIVEIAADAPEMQPKVRARETTFGRKSMMPDAMFGRGNLMEKRLQNRRDHLLHRHIETVVPRLGRLARANEWSHLLVTGETKAASALMNRLSSDLRQMKVQVVDLPVRSDEVAIRTFLREKLDELRNERFHQEYVMIMEQTVPEMRAVRLPAVCAAASLNAIQMLLMEAAPPREGLYCQQCGWLGLQAEKHCKFCQSELISSPHVYDNLADAVLAAGGDVLFSEKQVLPPPMEHVAARLRFPLTDGL